MASSPQGALSARLQSASLVLRFQCSNASEIFHHRVKFLVSFRSDDVSSKKPPCLLHSCKIAKERAAASYASHEYRGLPNPCGLILVMEFLLLLKPLLQHC